MELGNRSMLSFLPATLEINQANSKGPRSLLMMCPVTEMLRGRENVIVCGLAVLRN
jgi:hypothetical protein